MTSTQSLSRNEKIVLQVVRHRPILSLGEYCDSWTTQGIRFVIGIFLHIFTTRETMEPSIVFMHSKARSCNQALDINKQYTGISQQELGGQWFLRINSVSV